MEAIALSHYLSLLNSILTRARSGHDKIHAVSAKKEEMNTLYYVRDDRNYNFFMSHIAGGWSTIDDMSRKNPDNASYLLH
mgnify:CR=1 FL=1